MRNRFFRIILAGLLAVMLLGCGIAQAAPEVDALGGTAEWPQVRGLQWSMNDSTVLLIEAARGVEFEQAVDGRTRSYKSVGDVQLFGHDAQLAYAFSDETGLSEVRYVFSAAKDDATCAALLQEVHDGLTELYGEPYEDMAPESGWAAFTLESQGTLRTSWGVQAETLDAGAGNSYLNGGVVMETMGGGDVQLVIVRVYGGVLSF